MHENTFFILEINCICHALQFDTIQAMLRSVIQYDLLFLLCLLWPWPLTYIDIFWLGYGARNLARDIYNHKLVSHIPKALFIDAFIAMTITKLIKLKWPLTYFQSDLDIGSPFFQVVIDCKCPALQFDTMHGMFLSIFQDDLFFQPWPTLTLTCDLHSHCSFRLRG